MKSIYLRNFTATAVLVLTCFLLVSFSFVSIGRIYLIREYKSTMDNSAQEVARAAEGSMRDAMSLMDVCLSYTDGEVTEQLARDVLGTSGREFQFDFMDALIDCDAKKSLQLIAQAMDLGRDPQVFARDTVSHARTVLLAGILGDDLASVA